jgi:hypothetical protein
MGADAYELEDVRHRIERERAELEQALAYVSSRIGRRAGAAAAVAVVAGLGIGLALAVRRRRQADRVVAARFGRYALVRLP